MIAAFVQSNRAVLCPACGKCQRDCSHRHGPAYTVESLTTGELGTFRHAQDVKSFMWGRDFTRYRIYRWGVRFPWTDGDLHAFELALEGR